MWQLRAPGITWKGPLEQIDCETPGHQQKIATKGDFEPAPRDRMRESRADGREQHAERRQERDADQ